MTHRLPALVLVLLFGLPFPGARAAEKPTRADLQKALALHERSVVTVRGGGPGGRGTGPGVIVGAEGQVLTSVRHVGAESARVEFEGQTLPATVVLANAMLQVAVVAAPSGSYPAVPVRVSADSPAGQWLIGVVPGRGGHPATPTSALAREAPAPFVEVALALPPGTPLFDARGRLVAVAVQRKGRGCLALPLEVVKQQLVTQAAPP